MLGGSFDTTAWGVLKLRVKEVLIPEELVQARGKTLRSEILKLVNKELPDQWQESITVPILQEML
jgi:hypothetical protein